MLEAGESLCTALSGQAHNQAAAIQYDVVAHSATRLLTRISPPRPYKPGYDIWPDCGPPELDAMKYAVEVLETLAPAPTPSETEAKNQPKRLKRGEAALKIRAALESLANEEMWNVAEADIIIRSGVPRSTYYRALESDEDVKEAMNDYHGRRLGRGPARARDC